MAAAASYEQQPRTTITRLAKRASYDKSVIHSILDEGFLCHISYISDEGCVCVYGSVRAEFNATLQSCLHPLS
jgi:hypothetical protein